MLVVSLPMCNILQKIVRGPAGLGKADSQPGQCGMYAPPQARISSAETCPLVPPRPQLQPQTFSSRMKIKAPMDTRV